MQRRILIVRPPDTAQVQNTILRQSKIVTKQKKTAFIKNNDNNFLFIEQGFWNSNNMNYYDNCAWRIRKPLIITETDVLLQQRFLTASSLEP
jgi:hypothetical protein